MARGTRGSGAKNRGGTPYVNPNTNTNVRGSAFNGGVQKSSSTINKVDPKQFDSRRDSQKNITSRGQASAKSQRRGGVLRYPLEALTGTTDYLQIDIIEFKRPPNQIIRPTGSGANTLNRAVGRTTSGSLARKAVINDGSILLQVPSQVQDSNSVQFGDSEMNTIAGAAAGAISGVMKEGGQALSDSIQGKKGAGEAISDLVAKGKAGAENMIGNTPGLMNAAQQGLNAKLTSSALGVFGANVSTSQLLARSTGQVFNPNLELLFDKPTLRSFRFSFKMTPRSQEEARQCKLIIRSFKQNMAPKANAEGSGSLGGSSIFLKSPNIFELRYRKGNRDHPFLHKFKQCFLTDFSVNYTAEGLHTTYDDATPISMQMDMTFKEIEPIYDVDYKDSDNSVGF